MKRLSIATLLLMAAILFDGFSIAAEPIHRQAYEDLTAWLAPFPHPGENRSDAIGTGALLPMERFYQRMGYQPVWVGPEGLLPPGEILLKVMTNAWEDRWSFEDASQTARIRAIQQADAIASLPLAPHVQLDVVLTLKLIQYAHHISQGRVMPDSVTDGLLRRCNPVPRDIPAELAQAVVDNQLEAYIESLHPKGEAYQGLRRALEQYEQISIAGGWTTIAPGPTLARGDSGSRVEALKHRLKMTGDWSGAGSDDYPAFDERIEDAVKHFQRRHGLKEDGRVGKETLTELNVPIEERIAQLQINMERWHWYPENFGERYLLVNIPAFELIIVEAGRHMETLRVIVGKKARQTPIMSGRMTYLEFNPYWTIPPKIARKDILPKAVSDPTYLSRQGIRVFDGWDRQAQEVDPASIAWDRLSSDAFPYRLRQDPSDLNALGQVKFMFPNPLSIYIHDTPSKSLFDRQERIFSSGCVRVEDPVTLAHHLLSEQGWDRHRLEDTIARGDRKSVILDNPIAVHLVYFTAWLDADGTVQFREDIYGQDARLLLAIKQSTPDVLVQAENALPGLFAANANPERFPPEATGPAGRSSVAQPGSLGAARPTGI